MRPQKLLRRKCLSGKELRLAGPAFVSASPYATMLYEKMPEGFEPTKKGFAVPRLRHSATASNKKRDRRDSNPHPSDRQSDAQTNCATTAYSANRGNRTPIISLAS